MMGGGGGGGGVGKCVNRKVEDYDYELAIKPVTRCILPSSAFDGLSDSLRPGVVVNRQVDSSSFCQVACTLWPRLVIQRHTWSV